MCAKGGWLVCGEGSYGEGVCVWGGEVGVGGRELDV